MPAISDQEHNVRVTTETSSSWTLEVTTAPEVGLTIILRMEATVELIVTEVTSLLIILHIKEQQEEEGR